MNLSKWTWKNVELPPAEAERLALRFEAGCIEAALSVVDWSAAESEQIDLLAYLGDLYARSGDFRKGLEVDLKLVRTRPEEPVFRYNLACSHSRLGDTESALRALEVAVELGYQNADHIRRDRDLDSLRQDERFIRLLRRLDAAGGEQ